MVTAVPSRLAPARRATLPEGACADGPGAHAGAADGKTVVLPVCWGSWWNIGQPAEGVTDATGDPPTVKYWATPVPLGSVPTVITPVANPDGPVITSGLFWKLTRPASSVATTCADRPSNTSIPPPVGTRMSW